MKVSEAIDQLKVGDTVWVKGVVDVVYQGLHPSINIREVGWFSKDTEISLTDPKNEKVEVTEEQARLLKNCEGKSLFSLIGECSEDEEDLLARARLCGYTIKPKRWIVKYIPPFVDEFRYYSVDDEIFDITESSWTSDKEDAYPFTEKEKAEAVALLVDGSVEEI